MDEKTLFELEGQIERVTYSNEETGYCVLQVRMRSRRDTATVIGNILNPVPGEIIKMDGEWSNHPKYGRQFKVVSYKCSTPATVFGIEKYLGSGLIKGIGPVMAKRIVRRFKEKTLDVIEHHIEKLGDVSGIGDKRIAMIRQAWIEQREIRSVMIFLQSHGVSSGYAARIYKQYGQLAIKIVQENPYRLAMDITGIGFVTADKIAGKLGFANDSELRAEAGIIYVLHELADEGHVCYPYDPLIEKCRQILGIDQAVIIKVMSSLALRGDVVIDYSTVADSAMGEAGKAVYLAGFYTAETQLAERLMNVVQAPQAARQIDVDKAIQWAQDKFAIRFAEKQIAAIKSAATNKVLVITGGPGTGKTTIINAVLKIYSALKTRIVLAAPTGRAAKRMSEATGHEAKTIHRMLEYSMQKRGFQRNSDYPLDCHLLIVDESSMIDAILMHHLLKALPREATLILVGDVNQLPSVGPGNVLKDIIDSGVIPVVELNEIFRQARESSIIVNAHRINAGMLPQFRSDQDKLDDFYFVEQEDPQKTLEMIIHLVKNRIPERFGLDAVDDIQVLTPMHRGIIGTTNMNTELQKALNPGEEGVYRGGQNFRIHDKVMQIRNNYDKDVYNGDIGRVVGFDDEMQEAVVRMDNRDVLYDYRELDELVLAYAVSVHKAQGSEYPAVVIPVLTQHYLLLQRNLIYTAVTRGKQLVVLVGTKKALAIAVKNNKTQQRFTLLQQRLAG
ncbi:MAG: ATP-dependent RecD-like DNA helicase [Deltaproteobacteria bacterium]|nr:ATP-dependent RecD-like DNA helicase [Deltaproteobacteria bacterium]